MPTRAHMLGRWELERPLQSIQKAPYPKRALLPTQTALYFMKRALHSIKRALNSIQREDALPTRAHMLGRWELERPLQSIKKLYSYQLSKEPIVYQKSHTFYQKSPIVYQKSQIFYQKSPTFYPKNPMFYQKSPVFNQVHLRMCLPPSAWTLGSRAPQVFQRKS